MSQPLQIVFLEGSFEVIKKRIDQRAGHYMSSKLLNSQLATLEIPKNVYVFSILKPPESIVKYLVTYFLQTQRLQLRELQLSDSSALYTILGNRGNMAFYPRPYSLEETKNWIKRSQSSYEVNNFGLWALELKTSGTFIGQCGISYQDIDGEKVPEIGYHLHKNYWNKGYCTEAAKAILDYGFRQLNLEEIFIHTYIKNIPSQRIAQKLSMSKIKEYDKVLKNYDLVWKHVVFSMKKSSYKYKTINGSP